MPIENMVKNYSPMRSASMLFNQILFFLIVFSASAQTSDLSIVKTVDNDTPNVGDQINIYPHDQ